MMIHQFDPETPPGAARSMSPFGSPYVILTDGGAKEEGQPFPGEPHGTVQDALAAYVNQLLLFTSGADDVAWRQKPEIEAAYDENDNPIDAWRVYSRLAVKKSEVIE